MNYLEVLLGDEGYSEPTRREGGRAEVHWLDLSTGAVRARWQVGGRVHQTAQLDGRGVVWLAVDATPKNPSALLRFSASAEPERLGSPDPAESLTAPVFDDVDGDGAEELLIGSPQRMFCVRPAAADAPLWQHAPPDGRISPPVLSQQSPSPGRELCFGSQEAVQCLETAPAAPARVAFPDRRAGVRDPRGGARVAEDAGRGVHRLRGPHLQSVDSDRLRRSSFAHPRKTPHRGR